MNEKIGLSIIIPVYNEEKTLSELIHKVIEVDWGVKYEIIIVEDGSSDNSKKIINNLCSMFSQVRAIFNEKNVGKTQTVKRGLLLSKGEYVTIQDADLEYEPNELLMIYNYAVKNNLDVVYGNRFGKKIKLYIYIQNYIGNRFISFISNLLTYPRIKVWIPDMEVCYKLIRGDICRIVAKDIISVTNFGLEPEITARLSKYKKENENHLSWGILPITYKARSIQGGKKMKAFRDGFHALIEILRFNLTRI